MLVFGVCVGVCVRVLLVRLSCVLFCSLCRCLVGVCVLFVGFLFL